MTCTVSRLAAAAAILAAFLLHPGLSAAGDAGLEAAVQGDHRSDRNRARDRYRHPAETLAFFGIRPDMTVVEIYPGTGWYTEILGPYLRARGRLYAASWPADAGNETVRRRLAEYKAMLAARPDLYGAVTVTELAPGRTEIAPAGSADMVLTFRNVHNWMKTGFDGAVFAAMYKALKPGGILGIVEHRADPEEWPDPQALSGYVHQSIVVTMAEQAGFTLVGSSEVNANPKDTRNHPEGVWTLPPVLRLKDKDRDKYLAIGESDRMTLKFIKAR